MRLLASKFFRHLHSLLTKGTLYTLENDRLSERRAVEQCCFTAPALPPVSGTPENEAAFRLQIKRSTRSRAEVVELDSKGIFVHAETPSEVERPLEESLSLVYGGREPPAAVVKEASLEEDEAVVVYDMSRKKE